MSDPRDPSWDAPWDADDVWDVIRNNPYEEYEGTEDNMAGLDPDDCARCQRPYERSNIPNMLRCPGCGEYVEAIEDEDDGGTWDRSSRHRTRLDNEEDE